jgi:hypothetical protein
VTSQDLAPTGFELGSRLLDGPLVGAHHQNGGRRRLGLLGRGTTPHGRQASTPPRSQSCGHVLSVDLQGH